jgi:hypothetical protein
MATNTLYRRRATVLQLAVYETARRFCHSIAIPKIGKKDLD